ncbi:hypothetical protein KI387_031425, partial [Taxus chinensis]
KLGVRPLTKYTALSFFGDRFLRALQSRATKKFRGRPLFDPSKESNLQLFALVSLWIASKIHETRPIFVGSLKSVADKHITDQHFTTRDFIDAELEFMKAIDFNLGSQSILFLRLEDLLIQFRNTAVAAKDLKPSVCLDILDIMYESEDLQAAFLSTDNVSPAAILAMAYILTVPTGWSEFPLVPWIKIVCECEEKYVKTLCERILKHVLQTST